MIRYPHVAQRLFNTPLAISRKKAEIIAIALRDRFDIAQIVTPAGPVAFDAFESGQYSESTKRSYAVIAGVAIIPVEGTLVQKLGTLQPYSGMTGYDGIRANLQLALDDAEVRGIALDIDSPGGEVSGLFDLVDMIYGIRGEKPISAILTENAYSAAYAIASSADNIIVPRTGGTGSIGVISLHTDFSQALENQGIRVTLIQYGARKAEGNEMQPLSDTARKALQADVDAMGELFVETVARNRNLRASAVRATEAATFLGSQGVEAGLADAVMSPDEAFAAFVHQIS